LLDLREVDEIPLAAVPVQALAEPRVVGDVLRETLADHEADERLGAVVDHLVRDPVRRAADEVARPDAVRRLAEGRRAAPET
jgi:hypothetical protein